MKPLEQSLQDLAHGGSLLLPGGANAGRKTKGRAVAYPVMQLSSPLTAANTTSSKELSGWS